MVDNNIKMEETVTINWKGANAEVVLRSLTYGEYKKIRRKSVVDSVVNGRTVKLRDLDLYDELMLITSIVTAPFEKTIASLGQLSILDGKKIESAVETLNFPENDS
jgi:hypothetical protein